MAEKEHSDINLCKKKFHVPKRLIIIVMASLATAIQYTIRSNLSVTLVAMVNNTDIIKESPNNPLLNETISKPEFIGCPLPNIDLKELNLTNKPIIHELKGDKLPYSETTQGILLGSFFYGYILTHLFAGQLSANYGAKNCIFVSLLLSSVFTLFTHYSTHFDSIVVITLRVLTGMAQGVLSPAIYTLFASWVPKTERSTAFSLITIGGNIGAVITMPISAYLCESGNFFNLVEGWECVFYFFGLLGLVFTILWYFYVFDKPSQHPSITDEEMNKIFNNSDIIKEIVEQSTVSFKLDKNEHSNQEKKKQLNKINSKTPWNKMLKSKQVWVVAIAKFCVSWGNLMLMSKLPNYLERILHLDIQTNAAINSCIYIAVCISAFMFGYISDYSLRKGWVSKLTSRKFFESFSLFGSGLCMLLIPKVTCDENKIIFLMIMSSVFFSATVAGDCVIILDLTSAYSGSLYGLTNAIASIPGFLAPVLVGVLLNNYGESIETWNYVFIISGAIAIFGGIVFLLFAECEERSWGRGILRKTKSVLSMKLSIKSVKSVILERPDKSNLV